MRAASRHPSFEVPLLGLADSAATLYSCGDWRGTQGGHHDLYTLSGLYGERSLPRSHGKCRKYVDGGLALPQLRKCPRPRDGAESPRTGNGPVVSSARVPGHNRIGLKNMSMSSQAS